MRFMQLFLNAEFNCGGSVDREWVVVRGNEGQVPSILPKLCSKL
jgi:hypothetical protein